MSLQGRVVLITGGSTGIGNASARMLAARGATVVVNYLNSREAAVSLQSEIRKQGGECLAIQADARCSAEVDQMIDEVIATYGRIDVLVNNVGGAVRRSTFLECCEELWDDTITLNLKSTYLCTRKALQHMVPRASGRIINISSVAARNGSPGETVHYAAAKGAVNVLTVGLAKEFAGAGILVNAIAPGVIETPFHDKYSPPGRLERLRGTIPLGRLGTPEDVAELVAFLSGDGSSYITGEILTVSGGR